MFNENNHSEVDHLSFGNNFKIRRESAIYVGSNGIGKTSITNNIISRNPDYVHIDFEKVKSSFVSKKKDIIEIGVNLSTINSLQSELELLLNDFNFKKSLTKYGISSIAKSRHLPAGFNYQSSTSRIINYVNQIDGEHIGCLGQIDDRYKKIIVNKANTIATLREMNYEHASAIDTLKLNVLNKVEEIINEENSEICLLCGAPLDGDLLQKIQEQKLVITAIENELQSALREKFPNISSNNLSEKVSELKDVLNNISDVEIINIALLSDINCDVEEISGKKIRALEIISELTTLEVERNAFYELLIRNFEILKEELIFNFKIQETDIEKVEDEKKIKIKLPRNVDTYSTGELNYLTFLVLIQQSKGTDQNNIIIDDPLSSFDIKYQYHIAHEISKLMHMHNKIVICFTHNPELVNLLRKQAPEQTKYYYLNCCNNEMKVIDIGRSDETNFIDINKVISKTRSLEFNGYLKLLIEREDNREYHPLFHYDDEFIINYNGVDYNNNTLVNLINSIDYNTPVTNNFYEIMLLKIIYLASIRTWVEKEIFIRTSDVQKVEMNGKTLYQKLDILYGDNDVIELFTIPKSFWDSKRVFLNHSNHYKSQLSPFYYAMSISFDDIFKEIIKIKDMF